jgi:hypothetical protein
MVFNRCYKTRHKNFTEMPIENRQFLRFSLDIPTFRNSKTGRETEVLIKQISIGGCLIEWIDFVAEEDVFRLEFVLPNNNRLPLQCKIIYRAVGHMVGVKFQDITRYEQELLGTIISDCLEKEGLPLMVDPFSQPPPKFRKIEFKKEYKKVLVDEEEIEEEFVV